MENDEIAVVVASQKRIAMLLILLVIVVVITCLVLKRFRRVVKLGRSWPATERVNYSAISHSPWDRLLRRYVDSEGRVDYASWKASPSDVNSLDDYLGQLSKVDDPHAGDRPAKIEFWVNAYNAMTIRGLIREYPTSSIRNHTARLWGFNIWRDLHLIVGDREYSLLDIENTILRPLKEPRIHFAIVCGSNGCPRLRNEAYSAGHLEDQLRDNTQEFFADPANCTFDAARQELRLSPILKWYAADFGATQSEITQGIEQWLPPTIRALPSKEVKVSYGRYDWSLNERPSQRSVDAPNN